MILWYLLENFLEIVEIKKLKKKVNDEMYDRFFKMDPIIQIDVANGTNEDLKENLALEEANIGDAEDFESFNET